jgi:hypothetical protein
MSRATWALRRSVRGLGRGTFLAFAVLLAGCSAARVTLTDRSGLEQQLLIRSLERASADLDVRPYAGRRVTLQMFGLTKDASFAREYLSARLEERGVHVVTGHPADAHLKVFATVLAVDHAETLFGVPSLPVPVLAVPIPEIPLFKWVRNRGHVEIQVYAFDPITDRLVRRWPDANGRAKYDEFTVLLVISFSVTDVNRSEPRR